VPHLSRRSVLLSGAGCGLILGGGALGFRLVQDGTLPGKYTLATLDGACGSAPPPPRGPRPAQQAVSFYSAYRQRVVQMVTLLPAGARPAGLTVVLALHGSDSDATAMARLMAPTMTAAQVTNLAVVCADGGDTYWHAHTDGDDPVGMIVHEVLPRARADGLRGGPLGVIGASMGGYGALLLAERFGAVLIGRTGAGNGSAKALPVSSLPPVITAVAALSPAIFGSFAAARAANHAAFDSPAEFARNDVLAGAHALARVPAWIACGVDDPFGPQTAALRARLTTLTGHQVPGGMLPGCHDDAFWARNMPAALRFLAARYP
jgi:S-formylglutathione hydrolase FrmB